MIRVLLRPPEVLSQARARRLATTALGRTRWGAGRTVRISRVDAPDSSVARNDLLLEVRATERRADTYAAHAHELVQLLYDAEAFLRVEADLPTAAFDPAGEAVPTSPRARSVARGTCQTDAAAAAHDWALQAMRVPAAIALMSATSRAGKGVIVGHPDSGYSDHPMLGLGQLDLTRDRDVVSNDDDARDPLRPPKKSLFNLLPNPGHGTSTASALVGLGERTGDGFRGVALAARLVPIRATESVVQVFDTDVAKAVRWARRHGCHVVSMSLGGKGLFGLEDAIQEAVDDGMIVLAAAGNQVGFVTAPASYGNCLAVAASTSTDTPWSGSSHGPQVDVVAPGACVWAAMFDWSSKPPGFVLRQSNGTSYAVAHVAGVAALWIAHHGHAPLIARFGRPNVQAAFLSLLRAPGVCRAPAGWDHANWGAGIVDAAALLQAPLPAPHAVAPARRSTAPTAERSSLDRIAGNLGRPSDEAAALVDGLLGPGASDDAELLRRFEGEIVFHLSDPASRAALLDRPRGFPARGASTPRARVLRAASPQLRARVSGDGA